MSQEKVDRYKKDKANRKKNMRKEKAKRVVRRCVASVVVLALVGWFGYSTYSKYEENKPKQTAEINYTAITDYQQSLYTADGE
jgi:hypothetical protein